MARVQSTLKKKFGVEATKRKVQIIDPKKMGDAWVQTRIDDIKKKATLTPAEEEQARKILKSQVGNPVAFAHEDTVYMAANAPASVAQHEVLHTYAHDGYYDWLGKRMSGGDNISADRRNGFNEAMTEYFNHQVSPHGVTKAGDQYHTEGELGAYGHGPSIVKETRDNYLGGEKGEGLLRDCYFRGNCAPLDAALTQNKYFGGSTMFIAKVADGSSNMANNLKSDIDKAAKDKAAQTGGKK